MGNVTTRGGGHTTFLLCVSDIEASRVYHQKRSDVGQTGIVRPTAWHSVAASAPPTTFKNLTISRAKRSTAMPCWAANRGRFPRAIKLSGTLYGGGVSTCLARSSLF